MEVSIGDKGICDIYDVPSYHEGPANKISYINGEYVAKYITKGHKVNLECKSIIDLVEESMLRIENIDYSQLNEHKRQNYMSIHKQIIDIKKNIKNKICFDCFKRWYIYIMQLSEEEVKLSSTENEIQHLYSIIKDEVINMDAVQRDNFYKNNFSIKNGIYGKFLSFKGND